MTEAHKQRNIRAYQKKVAEHRCVTCGKQDERTLAGMVYCQVCADRHKAANPRKPKTQEQRNYENANKREWRARLKSLHACTICGEKDKRTINGLVYCARCAARRKKWDEEHRDKTSQQVYHKARRDRWREQGRCTYCGGKRDEPDKLICLDCRVKVRMKRRKRIYQKMGVD